MSLSSQNPSLLRGYHHSHFYHHRFVFPVLELYTNWTVKNGVFCVWLLSLTVICEIHGWDYTEYIVQLGENIPINHTSVLMCGSVVHPFNSHAVYHYMNGIQHNVLIQGTAGKHLGCFQFLGIVNKVDMNIHI